MKIKLLITALWLVIVLLLGAFVKVALADFSLPVVFKQVSSVKASPAFSVIEISDLHSGAGILSWDITNTVNTIIMNKALWNVKLVISAGDLYEQPSINPTNSNSGWFQVNQTGSIVASETLTNLLWELKTNGIPVMAVQGNHDADGFAGNNLAAHVAACYWTNVFTVSGFYANDPYYFTNMLPGDSRNFAMKFTVGNCKMLFIGLSWVDNSAAINPGDNPGYYPSFTTTNETIAAYAAECAWCSNLAVQYPNYNVIPVIHYFTGTNGLPGYKDLASSPDVPDLNSAFASGNYVCEGPGLSLWNAMKGLPNICAFMCGHVRSTSQVVSLLQGDDGHTVAAIKFNTQTGLNGSLVNGTGAIPANGGVFTVYTFYPALGTVSVRNYGHLYLETNNVSYGTTDRFLLNGEVSQRFNNFSNLWSFPLAVKSL